MKSKHVVITGASSGIGRACAEVFAAAGSSLLLTARRLERLERLAEELSGKTGAHVDVHRLDVRSKEEVESMQSLFEDFKADILINNAGLARGVAPLQSGEISDWDEMIETNIRGLLLVTRAVLPSMIARGSGHIINIGSIAGHEAYPGGAVYCGTKHAVAAINRGLAMDTLGTGVRVSSVDPGMVETEFSIVRFHGDEKKAAQVYERLRPLTAEDVADAVFFCATRPPHANIREMVLMPADQASAVHAYRQGD